MIIPKQQAKFLKFMVILDKIISVVRILRVALANIVSFQISKKSKGR